MQVTNWRLLAFTVLVLVVATPLIYLWHQYCISSMGLFFSARAEMATRLAQQKEEIDSLLATKPVAGNSNPVINQPWEDFDAGLAKFDANLSERETRPSAMELWNMASKYLEMHKRIDELNPEVRGKLALAYSNSTRGSANPRRAAQLFAQAAALLPGQRDELLVQASDFYVKGFDFRNAKEKIEEISSVDSLSPEKLALLAKVKANASWGQVFLSQSIQSNPELGSQIAKAIELNPQDLELPVYLALLYRQPEMRANLSPDQVSQMEEGDSSSYASKAEQIVNTMVDRNPESANALLQRFKYRASVNPFTSLADLEKAETLEPSNPDVQFELGKARFETYLRKPNNNLDRITANSDSWPTALVEAKANFLACKETTPGRIASYLYLGEVERLFRNLDGAVAFWLEGLNKTESVRADLNTKVKIRQNMIVTLIDRYDQNDADSEKWLDLAEEQLALLDLFISESESLSRAAETLFELNQSRKFLRAALFTRRGEYGSAIDLLAPAIRGESDAPTTRTFVMLRLLGTIYSQLGLDSQAAATFESAAEMAGNDSIRREFSQLASESRGRSGQPNVEVVSTSPPPADSESTDDWYQYARSLLKTERAKPPSQRDLTPFNQAMQRLTDLSASSDRDDQWRVSLLGIAGTSMDLDPSSREFAEMLEQLKALEADSAGNAELSIKLAEIYAKVGTRDTRLDLTDTIDRMLKQYESLAGQSADSYVLVANVLIADQRPAEARAKIQAGIEKHQDQQEGRKRLKLAMTSLLLTDGDVASAFESLRQLADEYPGAPDLTMRLAALCIQFPILNSDEAATWEPRLRQIEGQDGVYTKCLQVIRILRNVNNNSGPDDLADNRSELNRAKELCRSIVAQRPNWSAGHTMTGQVLLAQSVNLKETNRTNRNLDEDNFNQLRSSALRALTRAVELGESRRWVLVPLAQMQTPDERNQTLELLRPETIVRDPDLLRMQVSMSIAGNDTTTALNTVKFATKTNPDNPLNWLTLAAIQLNLGNSDDALASCEKARAVSEKTSGAERERSILNLFNFYATASQFGPQPTDKTWETKATELQSSVLDLFEGLEQSHQNAKMLAMMGDRRAGTEFVKIVDAEPMNKQYLIDAIEYFTSAKAAGLPAISEGLRLCQLLKQVPDLDDRERLKYIWVEANLYAKRGTEQDWQALKLLFSENNIDQSAPNAAEYNLLLAVLLVTKDAVTNSERQQNLEEAFGLVADGRNNAELVLGGQIKQLLAPLQEEESSQIEFVSAARDRFVEAAATNELAASQLVTIIKFFIEQKEWDSAEQHLAKLKTTLGEPLVDNLPAIALQAEIMKKKGAEPAEIIKMVNAFAEDLLFQISNAPKLKQALQCQRIAEILSKIDEPVEALKWNEKSVEIEPRYRLALAMENNKLGNKDKAVELCLAGYSETSELTYLIALTQVLITGEVEEIHFQNGNAAFGLALKREDLALKDRVNLLLSIANVRIAGENKTQEAIELYEQANRLVPGNLLILNNLATACSESSGKLNVAMDYINEAIIRHGNRPVLLDTKAVILMKQEKLTKALTLLKDITNHESDPRYWWHRAEVEYRIHQNTSDPSFLEAARQHFKFAESLNLSSEIFTPDEKNRLDSLEKNLSAQPPSATDADAPNPPQNSSPNTRRDLSNPTGMQVTL
ncbi:MAG: hypothetical protein MK108_03805 [Mariniblastus sp.]|nr:hypothetical protein [Mariniblastus sp.]